MGFSVSLQLWVLRAAPDGPGAVPPGHDALLADATRFARLGTREPGPHWDSLQAFVLSALESLDRSTADLPDGAVLRAGQQPVDGAAAPGNAAVPLLTVADLLADAEKGDVVVAGVVRAFKAWVYEGPPTDVRQAPTPTVDGYIKVISDAVAQGYTAAKVHPFGEAKRDVGLVRALRSEFPDIDLMIDPVCAYNLPDALQVGYALDELGYFWYENPISDYDLSGLAYLSSKLRTPLAVGEQNYVGFPALRDYLKSGIGFYVRNLGEYAGGLSHVLKSASRRSSFRKPS
ncbi:enolase C-terminal domain-like protein [Streptomyces sp. NPDC086549]|uniref:enolase C-terminal domain-like protein n=1 Tax=Streptomyces sp. NPDC086549 TaxID=3365752 RepID=UPI00382FBB40